MTGSQTYNNDFALINRCLRGDKRAFDLLVTKYRNRVLNQIMSMVGNKSDAEDVFQEAFIKAYNKLSDYNPEFSFMTWIFKIARNASIDFIRSRKYNFTSLEDHGYSMDVEDPKSSDQYDTENKLDKDLVIKIVNTLPEHYKIIFFLRLHNDLTYEEIADSLGMPIGTVKCRLYRARDIFKQKFVGLLSKQEAFMYKAA